MIKYNQKISTCFLIKLMGETLMKNLAICEFCKKYKMTRGFHCNHCIKKHLICDACVEKNKVKFNLRKIEKNSIYDSNLEKWA